MATKQQFAVGDKVRLVELDGEPLRTTAQLRGTVARTAGKYGELEVTFPTRDGRGGFDFWPEHECRLDTAVEPIEPV